MKKRKQKDKTVNSNAAGYLKSLLHPHVEVVDLYVVGKWLTAELSSGSYFRVRNRSFD